MRRHLVEIVMVFGSFLVWGARAAETNGESATTNRFLVDLPMVLRLADAQNLDVAIARKALAEARANRNTAVEQFFPSISPGVQYRRRDGLAQAVPSGIVSDAHYESYAPGATIGGQLAIGEAIYQTLAAKQKERASGEALEAQRQAAALTAAQRYFELVRAEALIQVDREAVSISKSYQEQIHSAVGAGIAFRGDELRVQTQTERYRLALRQSQERGRIAAAHLAEALHLDLSVEQVSEESGVEPITLIPEEAPLDDLMKQALHSRPELREAAALVTAEKEARNGAIYGPLVPSIGVQYFGGGFGGGPDHLPDRFGATEDFSATLGWRIGPGGLFDFGRMNATKARVEATALRLEKLRDAIMREVVESHTRVQSLAEQIPVARQNLSTASETVRLARERKEFGVGAVLEDLQAQQELVRARSDFLGAVADFNNAQFALRRAVGSAIGPASAGVRTSDPSAFR
jgi:outer membrane protein TolC